MSVLLPRNNTVAAYTSLWISSLGMAKLPFESSQASLDKRGAQPVPSFGGG